MNNFLDLSWDIIALSIFGSIGFFIFIIWPLVDAILYAIGHTIFIFKTLNKNKVIKRPFYAIYYLLKEGLFKGIVDRLFSRWETTAISAKGINWKPYFHFVEDKTEDE